MKLGCFSFFSLSSPAFEILAGLTPAWARCRYSNVLLLEYYAVSF